MNLLGTSGYALAGALLASACGRPEAEQVTTCATWIVDCPAFTLAHWSAAADPVWALSSGADRQPFAEILDVAFQGDAMAVLGDHRDATVHFINGNGVPFRTLGGRGSGPGELGSLDAFGVAGDGWVWGYDVSRRRLVLYASGGESKTFTLRSSTVGAWPTIVGVFGDSVAIVIERHLPLPMGQQPGTRSRDSTRLLQLRLPGMEIESIASVPREDIVVGAGGARAGIGFVPFGPSLRIAVDPVRGSAYWGFSDSLRIVRWSPGVEPHELIALATNRRSIDPHAMERAVAGLSQPIASVLAGSEPHVMPAFGEVLVDAEGFIWASEYQTDGSKPSHWAVFDLQGTLIRFVSLPSRFTLKAVRHPEVVGVFEESSGEQSVRMYRLILGGGGR